MRVGGSCPNGSASHDWHLTLTLGDAPPVSTISSRFPDQLIRLAIVFATLIGGVIALRTFALPPALKETGIQRPSAIKREIAKPISYAGATACRDCHEDKYEEKQAGKHRNLSCETCHGASSKHAEDPTSVKPYAPRDRSFCPRCHAYDPARPTGFPQINPAIHNPLKACITCHLPHAPEPPQTPQECSACHQEIARTKAVSSHALLECTTCHETPEQHKIAPRSVKPSLPSTREFCGTCHAKESANPEAPKIDIATHYEKYLCWQCHYPHSPEWK